MGASASLRVTGAAVSTAPHSFYMRLHIYMSRRMLVVMPTKFAVLEVIAEPTRRRILDAVRDGERSVGELVEKVGMHQPGVSRHLKVLRDAGLVEVRRDAQRRLYRLRPEPLMELDAWLEPYRAKWTARLDSLERHLRRTATPIAPSPKEHR
jgi:DNA-binding transcriptional ArsR family regulator